MKCAIGIVLFVAVVAASDEAISSQSNTAESLSSHTLTASASAPKSTVNDGKQQNKRLAYIGSASNNVGGAALSHGFKPIITSSYSAASHQQQTAPYTSSVSNIYAKPPSPYGSPYVSTSNVKHSSTFVRGLSSPSHGYQPQLTYSASQPTPVSYIHNPFQFAQQIYSHQLSAPSHYNHVHQPSYFGYPNTHQFSYSNQYQAPPHKVPIYNQGHPFTVPKHQQLITSKPAVLETPLPPTTSSSEVHHNPHGAVSYVNFSQLPKLPTPAALIATPPAPSHHQNVYYQQPQTFYSADYNKPFHPLTFSQLPSIVAATNYFPNHHQQHQQQHYAASAVQPYAHISKISSIPTQSSTAAQVVSVNVVPN